MVTATALEPQPQQSGTTTYWNAGPAQLVEHALVRGEGTLAAGGVLVVRTGEPTVRAPQDKFIVRDYHTEATIAWGDLHRPFSAAHFDALHLRMLEWMRGRDLFVQDCHAGADPRYRIPIRVITETAWHSLIVRNLFVGDSVQRSEQHLPEFTILHAPGFLAVPERDGTRSSLFVLISFNRRLVLIGGTAYGGELKKAIFTVLNHLLPERGVLPMQCSANVGQDGSVALFFGLTGTGKTTLSTDPARRLLGDDQHGWSPDGVFNFEAGCYAKCSGLCHQDEPDLWNALRFGAVLENVVVDPETRAADFNDTSLSENMRVTVPLEFRQHAHPTGVAAHPNHIFLLSFDVHGVLPPLARVEPDDALFHYLNGYTARFGSDGAEPTFSCCYAAPFLPRPAQVYTEGFSARLRSHRVNCWLLNTGWSGNPQAAGQRMNLPLTRALVRAAVNGCLDRVPFVPNPALRCLVPTTCPGVESRLLDPRSKWCDTAAYDRAAGYLAGRMAQNAERFRLSR